MLIFDQRASVWNHGLLTDTPQHRVLAALDVKPVKWLSVSPTFALSAGVTNLFERNYTLREGYPEAGRDSIARLDGRF